LSELFGQCKSTITPAAQEKGLEMIFNLEPQVKNHLLGDPVKLRQVFMNILSNAVKFTEKGAVQLFVSAKKADSENMITIYFEVKDSGIGMTEEQLEKIFEPFAQADNSVTRKFGGTGLGLAIAKTFIEMMGGKLYVESAQGIGSKFSFELTFELSEIIANTENIPQKTADEIEKLVFQGEVLVCEDNDFNQVLVRKYVEKMGMKVEIAQNGKRGFELVEARHKYNQKQYDLILMDIHMPVMDGIEATTKILALGVTTPIIAVTADVMSDSLELYKQIGISDVVAKPFKAQELWGCLTKYISGYNSEDDNLSWLLNGQKPEEEILDDEKISELFVKIEYLLKENNVMCLNYLNKLKSIPDTEELVKQIQKFAFREALKTLEKIRAMRTYN
jgi:CheY-like chemotaxis protein